MMTIDVAQRVRALILRQRPPHVFMFALITVTIVICSGCSWQVNRFYEGPRKDLSEVAVLLAFDSVIYAIDGNSIPFGIDTRMSENHILPGYHTIKCRYFSRHYTERYTITEKGTVPVDISRTFEGGNLYSLIWDKASDTKATMIMDCEGTVESNASFFGKKVGAPAHWKQLAKRAQE